jgi:hypothetical protein
MEEAIKLRYIDEIRNIICSKTSMNFQNQLRNVLKVYYEVKGKTFEMPQPFGGDYKNDGWVKEDAIFYMIYSPSTSYSKSIASDIRKKFKNDIFGLANNVYKKGMWNGTIKKVIFVVNLFDNDLPPDQYCEYEAIYQSLRQEYGVDFNYEIIASKNFVDILESLKNENLRTIKLKLNAIESIDLNIPSGKDILEVIEKISGSLNSYVISGKKTDCSRISTPKKIKINHLEERKQEIDKILEELPIVGDVINEMLQNDLQFAKFELTRDYIIDLYNQLSDRYSGVTMYDKLIEELLNIVSLPSFLVPTKFLVVFIFDRCDIFERE